jgi:hypothetical protein
MYRMGTCLDVGVFLTDQDTGDHIEDYEEDMYDNNFANKLSLLEDEINKNYDEPISGKMILKYFSSELLNYLEERYILLRSSGLDSKSKIEMNGITENSKIKIIMDGSS